jgi:hypothetical protein
LHVAPVEKKAGCPILFDERRTQNLGEASEAPAPPQVYLEQAITRGIETLGEEKVVLVRGEYMRDAPLVDQDLYGLRESRDRHLLRLGLPFGIRPAGKHRYERNAQEKRYPNKLRSHNSPENRCQVIHSLIFAAQNSWNQSLQAPSS